MNEYKARDLILKDLGYSSYQEYLKSPKWELIRRLALERDGYICRACRKNAATEVHHFAYTRPIMLGIDIWGVAAVCHGCHENGSVLDGKVVQPSSANARMGFTDGPKLDPDDSIGMNFLGVGCRGLASRFLSARERIVAYLGSEEALVDFALRFSGSHGETVILEVCVSFPDDPRPGRFVHASATASECLDSFDLWMSKMEIDAQKAELTQE